MGLGEQVVWLVVLAVPISCVSWTITQEEVLRELQNYCVQQRDNAAQVLRRKFFYLLTCHYCLSHYVAIAFLALTRFKLLYQDWRGYIIGLFALVWIANQYMSAYALLRQDLKKERYVAKAVEHKVRQEIEPQVEIHKPAA